MKARHFDILAAMAANVGRELRHNAESGKFHLSRMRVDSDDVYALLADGRIAPNDTGFVITTHGLDAVLPGYVPTSNGACL